MQSRGSLSRSIAIAIVFCILASTPFVHAQQDQAAPQNSETVENEESSSSPETTEQATADETEDLSSEDSETVSAEPTVLEGSASDEEVEESESVEVPDFFDPTEEISEDFGVDFPVDI